AAAMKANELALAWLIRGDINIGQGWMNRARRLLAGAEESLPHGYLAYLDAVSAAISQDLDSLAVHVQELGRLAARLESPAVSAL
ncbi:helix-turn-helix transcriptional regulator, partial [Mycobacterium sp. ITM-2017-0098]